MQVKKIGDEYWAHVVKCKDPKACTIVLRGASKDILNEVERNLQVRPTHTFRKIYTSSKNLARSLHRHGVVQLLKLDCFGCGAGCNGGGTQHCSGQPPCARWRCH